ncbi:hypothetical protein [Chitinolyticbacter albus]|uniref:hypothetical protein n=1 Tax=Chitinolyticbacter albus TaxID=2961951 RepID=UPI00210AA673|nr:hypothetical protein [Chitinolyticbacter albus]
MHTQCRMRPLVAASAACIALVAPLHAAPSPAGFAREVEISGPDLANNPLSLDRAVRRALVTHPALQPRYLERGIAPDALAQALTKVPGTLDIARDVLGPSTPGDTLRSAVLAAIAEAQSAWYTLAAAQAGRDAAEQARQAALAHAELAEAQAHAGNLAEPELLAARLAALQAETELAHAASALRAAQRTLNSQLGLPVTIEAGTTGLPPLPSRPVWLDDTTALLDFARRHASAFKQALRAEATAEAVQAPHITARTITLPLGHNTTLLADDGDRTRWPAAQLAAHTGLRELEDAVLAAQQQAAFAWRQAELAAARQPLQAAATRAALQRYNGMLAGVDTLLERKREQLAGRQDEVAARRDAWIALAYLQVQLGGTLPAPLVTGGQP